MSSAAVAITCFNTECRDAESHKRRRGWRLWSGDYAQLCDRCACTFEEGRFCDTFHLQDSGWRCCQSCGKRVHCGCIVSLHTYVVLDLGGIECRYCANKRFNLTCINPAWPSFADIPFRSSTQPSGPGFSELLQPRDLLAHSSVRPDCSLASLESNKIQSTCGRLMNGYLDPIASQSNEYVVNCGEKQSSCRSKGLSPAFVQDRPPSAHSNLALSSASTGKNDSQAMDSSVHPHINDRIGERSSFVSQSSANLYRETQLHNSKPLADSKGRNQLLSRYMPRISDQELQKITGNTSSAVTPLFEKMLSASDAGRIGRLVLPKRCAETYFPPISEPEGLPLKIQDVKGHDWIFQFRFWPNNNSRMYVLEGITPCIQSMELQAGDIVTFSRLEPEGKLLMGFRKASADPLSDQALPGKSCNGISARGDSKAADAARVWSKVDKSGYIAKEVLGVKSTLSKRKNGTLSARNKRLKIGTVDLVDLEVTLEETQGLLRPPSDRLPNLVIIEGCEFEEYEDAPVLGRPTIMASDFEGVNAQWAQCEDCLKWRKLPFDALLPARWTCSKNLWDPERSSCGVEQELTKERIQDLLSIFNSASRKWKEATVEPDSNELPDGLDGFAKLALVGEEALTTSRHPRHRPGCSCIVCIQPPSGKGPKHDPCCPCNFCVTMRRRFRTMMLRKEKKQSEKELEPAEPNPMQKVQIYDQVVVDSVSRGSTGLGGGRGSSPEPKFKHVEGVSEDASKGRLSCSPFVGQIDLNMQPEREEELSPRFNCGGGVNIFNKTSEDESGVWVNNTYKSFLETLDSKGYS